VHRGLTEAEQIMLRQLIDNAGIGMVLATIADICGKRAEDIATDNASLARRWDKISIEIDGAIQHAVGL
jgi:hypothetical protein